MISTHGYVAANPPLGAADTGGQVVYIIELAKAQVTPLFYLGLDDILIGVLIVIVVGAVVSAAPALQARRLTIIQALGRS